jgi:chorismate mutase
MQNDFVIISGPCSVESEGQVFETAKQLKEFVDPDYFRAGLWKPRTRPESFEGIGIKGIEWLQKIEKEFSLKVLIEVGCASHVDTILKNDFSAYWIGARTVSNPFSVKEIIEATGKKNIDIFIKNPIFPDIDLWTGVIERYLNSGFKNIFAVHRGFFPYEKTHLRNLPMWEIPIELSRRFPELKIICDPSHIAGSTKYIQEISQQAINLNMNGLMIEAHHNPEAALSDKKQQIKPVELKKILNNLSFKTNNYNNINYEKSLNKLRTEIDNIDYKIIDLLSKRFGITDEIGKLKKELNITTLQIDRWKTIVDLRLKYANSFGLSDKFVAKILELIHKESIKRQDDIINN